MNQTNCSILQNNPIFVWYDGISLCMDSGDVHVIVMYYACNPNSKAVKRVTWIICGIAPTLKVQSFSWCEIILVVSAAGWQAPGGGEEAPAAQCQTREPPQPVPAQQEADAQTQGSLLFYRSPPPPLSFWFFAELYLLENTPANWLINANGGAVCPWNR